MLTPLSSHVSGSADAPVVVLLHSLATSSRLWEPQLQVWSTLFRVIRVDLPGHGTSPPAAVQSTMASMAAEVSAVLDQHGVDRAAIVGLSLGGMVAQALALQAPDKVKALVIAHAGARSTAPVRAIWDQRLAAFEATGFDTEAPATLARWFTPGFIVQAPLTIAAIKTMIKSTSPHGYVNAIRAIQQLDHLDQLHRIACPTLVICGEHDHAVPPEAAQAIAEAVPGARFAMIDSAAHLGNVEQPVRFTELVGAFLSSLQ